MDSKGQIHDSQKGPLPEGAVKLLPIEKQLLANIPEDQRIEALINLRFKAWLSYNKLKPETVSKIKMKLAFRAGFMSREAAE